MHWTAGVQFRLHFWVAGPPPVSRDVERLNHMRRFSSVETCVLILAALFFAVGLVLTVHPTEAAWAHPTTDGASTMPKSYIESISKTGARVYVVFGMLLG